MGVIGKPVEPAPRIGFTVRTDPAFPERIVIESLDGDGLHRSFLLTLDQAADLRDDLADLLPAQD